MKYSCYIFLIIALGTQFLFAEPSRGQALKEISMDLNIQNGTLKEALTQIKHKSKLRFVYNENLVSGYRVSVNVKSKRLDLLLKDLLKNTKLSFEERNGLIVLYEPQLSTENVQEKIPLPTPAPAILLPEIVERTVKGSITDKQNGEPLPGVSILVKGSSTGAISDVDGKYSIRVSETASVTLVFSFIGYKKEEVELTAGQTVADFALAADMNQLNELVITGYATQSRADFTGSSSHIGAEALENRPVQSFVQALAGQAAGVNVIQPSGILNNPPVFRIRGFNSINLSSYPLIIVDGVAVFTGSVGTMAANNPLADINPSDIESMDILKDASATAIYGSRAANGVVVITTKKGKTGKTKVVYDGWVGMTSAYNLPSILNAEQYAMIKNEALVNGGAEPAYFLQKRADGSTVDTKWYDYAYRTGISHNHNLSFSGATDATSYFVSTGYSDQQGFMVQNTFNRKIARVNLDHKLTKRITLGTNVSFSNSMNKAPSTGSLSGQAAQLTGLARETMVLPPNVAPYNEDGSYNIVGNSLGYGANKILSGYYNPVVLLDHDTYTSENNNLIANVYAEIELISKLKFKTSYNLNQLNVENITFTNPIQGYPGYDSKGSAVNATTKNKRSDWTNVLSYSPVIAKNHNLSVLAGFEQIGTENTGWGATRTGLTDTYYTTYQGGYSTITSSGTSQGENRFRSFFSNLNYDFAKKYLLSASFRRDGYSGLSSGNKYGNFGGGSLGWNISEEEFFKNSPLSTFISGLKLRGSYGQVGNINIGNYPSLSLYNSGLYGTTPTLSYNQAGNPDLKWETSKKTDFGINVSLWNGRITVDADYYNNNINGMILNAQQAPSKGVPGNAITTNIGSMYNRGLEFSIDAHILNKSELRWSANFNISTLKNRVTELANGVDIYGSGLDPSNVTRVGYSLGSIYVVETTGVNPANGQRTYYNKDRDVVQYNYAGAQKWTYLDGKAATALDAKLDGVIMGPSIPTFYGGFNNNLSYRGFDLSVNVGYSGGNKLYNGTKTTLMDQRFYNNSTDILRRWTTPGQITDVPKVVYNDNFSSGSSLANSASVENGGFVKLRSAAIGYKVPTDILARIKVSSMRIYAQGTNLFILTKYTGTDPEVSSNGDSNSAPGVEKNSAPQARTFTLGLNIGF